MRRIISPLGVMLALYLAWSGTASGQVTFQPAGCDFRVWFVTKPITTTATIPAAGGSNVVAHIAELNARLDDGNAHYFRAECSQISVGRESKADLIETMTEFGRMNHFDDVKVWVEERYEGKAVGRLRGRVNSGQRVYFFDVRRYVSESNVFFVWAGAERFPTEGIIMFFRSVAYNGRSLNSQ